MREVVSFVDFVRVCGWCTCIVGTILAALLEILGSEPIPGTVYVVFGSACLLLLAAGCALQPTYGYCLRIAIFIVALCALYYLPWSGRKSFVIALRSIRAGMTIEDVDRIMQDYANFRRVDLRDGQIVGLSFRHTDHGNFNADIGAIDFELGAVTSVEFLAD